MKTTNFLRGLMALALILISLNALAQARGRSNGRDRGQTSGYQRDNHHPDRYTKHQSQRDVYVHRHAPVYRGSAHHHHHHYRPVRYVYYRDHNVYYDCNRNVYITYSGRGWTISKAIPVTMHHVDMKHAHRVDVNDYYDDDFVGYLDRNRPNGRIYAEW